MTEVIRTDAIGQPIVIGTIVQPFGNNTTSYNIAVVTRFNPKSVVMNDGMYFPDDRVVVITENLIAQGRQQEIDELRLQYDAKMDYRPLKEAKTPIRYLLAKTKDGNQFVLRFEQNVIEDARSAYRKFIEIYGRDGTVARVKRSQWSWDREWISVKHSLSFRALPSKIAKHVKGDMGVVEIPPEDWLVNGEAI